MLNSLSNLKINKLHNKKLSHKKSSANNYNFDANFIRYIPIE